MPADVGSTNATVKSLREAYKFLMTAKARLGADTEPGRQIKAAQDLIAGVAEAINRAVDADPALDADVTAAVLAAFPGSRLSGSTPR